MSSPLLTSSTPLWRSQLLSFLIMLAFIALAARAFYVQVWNSAFFVKQGDVRFVRTLDLSADRGKILDTNGVVLAFSSPAYSIWADPQDVTATRSELLQLAKYLGIPVKDLDAKLAEKDKQFVWLKRQLSSDTEKAIMAMRLPGIYEHLEYTRSYPEGESMAQVVGFTNLENRGQDGIELAFNKDLAGNSGYKQVIKDRMGRPIGNVGETIAPIPGKSVQLSIDSRIQSFAYNNLRQSVVNNKAKDGSIVVLDANTGGILAMANYPSYNVGNRSTLVGANIRNRALTDSFEPGSTMKPLVVALALEKGLVTPDTLIDTSPGYLYLAGYRITDTHENGIISVSQLIQRSSNIGAAKIGLRLTPKEMWEMYRIVGFGQKPTLPFPGITPGLLRPYQTWRPVEQATMSYGYGIAISLMQLAHAYIIFARDGQMVPLSILKTPDRVNGAQVIAPKFINEVRDMLAMVTAPGGTATEAQTIGYSVGGKTGTSRVQEGKGYAKHKYRVLFVGIAPLSHPRIIIAVMINTPTAGTFYGGTVAAPVFRKTAQETLKILDIPPDLSVAPDIQTIANNKKDAVHATH